jgi:hypothetical protein
VKKDFYMHYKSVGRFLLILKYSNLLYKSYEILNINYLVIFFFIKDLKDLDNISVSNYFYFFKYFFGKIGFFLNYSYSFSLNIGYHTFTLQSILRNRDVFFPLYFFLNDVHFMILNNGSIRNLVNKDLEITVHDMNFFTEKKTTLGFFNLMHKVTLKVVAFKTSIMETTDLYTLFKI